MFVENTIFTEASGQPGAHFVAQLRAVFLSQSSKSGDGRYEPAHSVSWMILKQPTQQQLCGWVGYRREGAVCSRLVVVGWSGRWMLEDCCCSRLHLPFPCALFLYGLRGIEFKPCHGRTCLLCTLPVQKVFLFSLRV